MNRHLRVAGVVLTVLGLSCLAFAVEPPAKPAAATGQDEAAANQQLLAKKYREFEQTLLILAQRLERSPKPEDRERAAVLRQAILKARDADINSKFDRLITTLKSSKSSTLQEIQQALAQNKTLAEDLQTLLDLLRSQNREELLKAEKLRYEQLVKMLDKAIVDQKNVRAQNESGKTDPKSVAKDQNKVTKYTESIDKAIGKNAKDPKSDSKEKDPQKGDNKKPKADGSEKSDGKGKPKPGEGPPSDGKGKPGPEGQPGQPGEPPPAGQPPQKAEEAAAQKQIREAIEGQKRAEDEIEKKKRQVASRTQDEVIRNLEAARKRFEELLKQAREEEKERILAALQERCERMLQLQIAVRDDTSRTQDEVGKNPDKKPTRANEQKALELSKREDVIVTEANRAIQLLEAEGSAVAFPEIFHQVRDDMKDVAHRLLGADVGPITVGIEDDIIASLKDMIEALKKAQRDLKDKKPPPNGQTPPPPNQPLVDVIAELKMIRAMQVRINSRTITYGREYDGEQAPVPGSPNFDPGKADAIQKKLTELAERQQKLSDVVSNIATGKNR